MILEPRLSLKDPFEADMSGLTLALSGADTVRVARVLPGSPAEGLGIRPGDVLEAVDGRPVASIGLSEVRRWFRQEGRTLRLTLQRDGERLQPALTTRRMI
jgi:C-terminal processing protease CtpA/Prc